MYRQSEQIFEEQLMVQNKDLTFLLVIFTAFKALKNSSIKKLTLKMFTEFKKGVTFASTVPVLHTIRTANGSFFLYSYGK